MYLDCYTLHGHQQSATVLTVLVSIAAFCPTCHIAACSMDFPDSKSESSNTSSEESPDAHLWGYLQPCNARLSRIDLWRIHPKYTLGRNSDTNQIVLPGLKISEWKPYNVIQVPNLIEFFFIKRQLTLYSRLGRFGFVAGRNFCNRLVD